MRYEYARDYNNKPTEQSSRTILQGYWRSINLVGYACNVGKALVEWWVSLNNPKTGAVSLCEVGPKVGAKNIKEKTGYMRIKKFQRSMERKRTIAPAEWQEYIEI